MTSWKNCQLWLRLLKIKGDEAEQVRVFLSANDCMNSVETILNKAATSSKDFTLHDSDHSFRVAERIWEIIPNDTKKILSEYELSLLLLSSYLHDIGMTPEYNKVNNLYLVLTSN